MADLVLLHQTRGMEQFWVAREDEEYWIEFWTRGGHPCARWRDYVAWGHRFWPDLADTADRVMLLRTARKRGTPVPVRRVRRSYRQ